MIKLKTISMSILLIVVTIIMAVMPLNAYAVNKDYVGHWAENTIQAWLDNDYVSGYPDGSFKPDDPITRAEFITIVNKLLGFSETTDISFIDVVKNDWFYQEVQKSYKAGYMSGFTVSIFSPNSYLTREQAAVIVSKIIGLQLNPENVQAFKDSNLISDWAIDYVNAAALAKIILGYSEDNTFRPQNPITRAESLTLIERINQAFIVDPSVPEGTIIPPPIGGGGGGGAPGPIDQTPSTIDMNITNLVVMIGIDEEFKLANNLILNTADVALTYTTDNINEVIYDPLNGIITGKKQGIVNVTIKASKAGYYDKSVDFQIIVAPILLDWTDIDPSGNKYIGDKQNIIIDISLLEGAVPVENVAVTMLWEKYVDSSWVAVEEEDISITYNSTHVKMNNGIYQLIKGIIVDKETSFEPAVVSFNKVGQYKLTVYCIKE